MTLSSGGFNTYASSVYDHTSLDEGVIVLPFQSRCPSPTGLSLDDFKLETPRTSAVTTARVTRGGDLIDGVTVTELAAHSDPRGSLSELLTMRDGATEPIVHVYQVTASAGSIRAWVIHRRQYDRLAFLNGRFRIALYDIRPGSHTFGLLNVFTLGREQPGLLRIPPNVIHGVQNVGDISAFVNMPTAAYDPRDPDKARLPYDDQRVPFRFDE